MIRRFGEKERAVAKGDWQLARAQQWRGRGQAGGEGGEEGKESCIIDDFDGSDAPYRSHSSMQNASLASRSISRCAAKARERKSGSQ